MTGQPRRFFQCFCPLNKWLNWPHFNRSNRPVAIDFFYSNILSFSFLLQPLIPQRQKLFKMFTPKMFNKFVSRLPWIIFVHRKARLTVFQIILRCLKEYQNKNSDSTIFSQIWSYNEKRNLVFQTFNSTANCRCKGLKNKLWFIRIDVYILDCTRIIKGIKNNKTETCEWKKFSLSSDNQR